MSTYVSEVLAPSIIALMREAARTSETSADIDLTTRQYISEDSELLTRRRENLKSLIFRSITYARYFTSKSFAAVCDALSNLYPDKKALNKTTVHQLVKTFQNTGSVCLQQVLIA
jgi:hypothetical protein